MALDTGKYLHLTKTFDEFIAKKPKQIENKKKPLKKVTKKSH